MTDITFSVLAKYDSYFYTASKADYIHGLTKNELNELITAAAEVGIVYVHNGCPKCCLEFIKKLAVPYYKEKEERAKKVKEEEQIKNAQTKPKQPKLKKGNNYERQSQEDERRGESSTNEA